MFASLSYVSQSSYLDLFFILSNYILEQFFQKWFVNYKISKDLHNRYIFPSHLFTTLPCSRIKTIFLQNWWYSFVFLYPVCWLRSLLPVWFLVLCIRYLFSLETCRISLLYFWKFSTGCLSFSLGSWKCYQSFFNFIFNFIHS